MLNPASGAAIEPDEPAAEDQRQLAGALHVCHSKRDATERLACYDDLAVRNAPATFAGKLGYRSKPFALDRPHRLRYRSDGVIFVLYLLDAAGAVVQNLHLGGGGEDSFVIETPGTYALQIDGSASWKIWIEPL